MGAWRAVCSAQAILAVSEIRGFQLVEMKMPNILSREVGKMALVEWIQLISCLSTFSGYRLGQNKTFSVYGSWPPDGRRCPNLVTR